MSLPIDIPPILPERPGAEPLPTPVGAGSPTPLPAQGETERLELLQAGLGSPVPLVYGRHIVGGWVILQHEQADGKVVLFIALGEGPWGSAEKVWVNGIEVQGDANKFHFHPGLDGQAGTETDPGTPNQKICSFWPAGITPAVTFSRTAYIGLKLDRDPEAPGPGYDVRGVYLTRKVRIFDQNGNQTSFAYSANPAWCILDLIITRWLKPYALAGAELSAEEKARIDFAAWKTAADDCDYDIGGGIKRFECHPAFVSEVDTLRALEQMLLLCRGYLIEKDGKWGLYVDKDRASLFTAGPDEIGANSLAFLRKPQRELANQFIFRFRALDSGAGVASKDFQPQVKELADETHQDNVGRIIKAEIDFGNQTAERVERLGVWLKGRTMLTRQVRARLLPGTAAIDLLPGDLITAPDELDYPEGSGRIWEILEITDNPDGSRDLFAQEFDNSIFTDTAGAQQSPTDTAPGEGPQPVGAPTTAPPAPTWASFTGEKGIFRVVLNHPTLTIQAFETLLLYEVQLASNSTFTTNVTSHTLGSKLEADIIKPRVTRYARARCRFPQSPWSPWANYGSPTAVSSGHPADDLGQGSAFDPSDPRIGDGVRPGTRSATFISILQKLTDLGLVQDPDQFASFFGSTFGMVHRRPLQVGFVNTDFEQGGSNPLDADSGWEKTGGNTEDFAYETASPLAGIRSLKIIGDAVQHKCLRNRFGLVVRPDEKFYIQATGKVSATGVQALMGFEWQSAGGGYVGAGRISFANDTSPTTRNMVVTAPATAARGYLCCWNGGWGTAGTAWFDEIVVNKVAADDQPVCVGRTEGAGATLGGLAADGRMKGAEFTQSNVGVKTGDQSVCGGGALTGTGWKKAGIAKDYYIGPNAPASIKFDLTYTIEGSNGAVGDPGGQNIGLWIGTGTSPASPVYTRAGSGELIYTNPPANATKIQLYVKIDQLGIGDGCMGSCTQPIVSPLAGGIVA